ncbi:MAG: hypothetical protein CMO75_00010 [Verrucomicrobiales bacterium]|nr:hypothetical protein [Verrucomicrobiales bacterium]
MKGKLSQNVASTVNKKLQYHSKVFLFCKLFNKHVIYYSMRLIRHSQGRKHSACQFGEREK